jgi:hypothetical protein
MRGRRRWFRGTGRGAPWPRCPSRQRDGIGADARHWPPACGRQSASGRCSSIRKQPSLVGNFRGYFPARLSAYQRRRRSHALRSKKPAYRRTCSIHKEGNAK